MTRVKNHPSRPPEHAALEARIGELENTLQAQHSVERELRAELAQFRSLVELATDGIILVNEDERFLYANVAAHSLLGVAEGELIGKAIDEYLNEAGRATIREGTARRLAGISDSYEVSLQRLGGGECVIRIAASPIMEDNRFVGAVGVLADVTREKEAEQALRESERKYRTVVDSVGLGVAVISSDMRLLTMNKRMLEWFPTRNLTDQPYCYQVLCDPPREFICPDCATHRTLLSGCSQESLSTKSKGDVERCFRVVSSPVTDGDGRVIAAVQIMDDVTARIRAENAQKEYAGQLEALWNEQARLSSELAESLEQLAVSKEETEQALRKLQGAQASIVHAEKMASVGVLAAGIAHEINNPIGFISSNLRELANYTTKIRNYLGWVSELEQSIAAEDYETATRIRTELSSLRQTLKLEFVLEDLLELVKDSLEGTDEIETIVRALKLYSREDDDVPMLVDVCDAIENSIRVVWNQIKYKAQVVRDYKDAPPILGHLGALQQVFSNLLTNAAQAIPEQGEIRISVHQQKDRVIVHVSDNGAGIASNHLGRIFEPFFTTKDVGQGTGLGLSIVYDIVQKHGGDIKVESQLGKGTTFMLCFPVNKQPVEFAQEIHHE
ncbi:PAS domain S-box protein [bacterium]|nr:PAS domain S-box protein [bacterium]MBU1984424.1 PAS domain S-box protein [bacterium]